MRPDVYRWAAIAVLLLGTTVGATLIDHRADEFLAQPLENISMTVGNWKGERDEALRADILQVLAPTSYISRTYRRGEDTLSLFVAYYANQRAGESMHSPKHCLPGSGWEITSYGVTDMSFGNRTVKVNRDTIEKDGVRMAVIYWYQSRRRIIADEYLAKMYLVRDAMVEGRTGGSIVRIICKNDPAAIKAGLELGSAVIPQVQRCITGATAHELPQTAQAYLPVAIDAQ